MDLLEMIRKNEESNDAHLKAEYSIHKENTYLIATLIDKLYNESICTDIKITCNILEADYSCLFTEPKIYFKLSEFPDVWYLKPPRWVDQFYINCDEALIEDKNKLYSDLSPEQSLLFDSLAPKFNDYVIALSSLVETYKWSFNNIDIFKMSPLWKHLQSKRQKDQKERSWIGNLSQSNYLETLSMISHISYRDLKTHIVSINAQNLEANLSTKEVIKIKHKL